jgi:type IV pilus assembly protein PilF
MSVWRVFVAAGALLITVGGLSACHTAVPQLDTLTPVQPDSTRQRAMRRLSLATAYYEQNQNEVALQEVRAALQIDPQFADAYSLLGLIHQREQAPALAQQSFEQAVTLASKPPVRAAELAAIQHNYGWFLCEQNHFAPAHAQFERALSEPLYRQADKTRQAMVLCQNRAAAQSATHARKP